ANAPDAEQLQLLQACASQTALAIERALLADAAQRADVSAESERARSALLSSVSHELRTPLAVVMGALSSMLDRGAALDPTTREQLTTTAYGEAELLNRLVDHLLAMTRLETGNVPLRTEWQSIEEIIGAALALLDERLVGRPVAVVVPPDLPLVALDGRLVTQVVMNLLENALTYTPPATPIRIRAMLAPNRQALPSHPVDPAAVRGGPAVLVEVADAGPGLPAGAEGRVFEKFYRGPGEQRRGVGLGLTICRGIVDVHGGAIWAEQGPAGGAVFRFWLPIDSEPPQVQPDDLAAHQAGKPWRKAS
ncbi:MAG: histidine kinase, partial [Chloroflexales bacterium]|nr:histidine kinase [Chloroflexales bacterium]